MSDLSLLPPMAEERPPSLADWPTDRYAERMRGSSSMRVILGAVLLLGALGVAALMVMYETVHEGDPREGVTAMQPAPTATATATSVPAPAAETATASATAPEAAPETATAPPPEQAIATAAAKPARAPVRRPAAVQVPRQTPKPAPRPHGRPSGALPFSEEDVFDGRK